MKIGANARMHRRPRASRRMHVKAFSDANAKNVVEEVADFAAENVAPNRPSPRPQPRGKCSYLETESFTLSWNLSHCQQDFRSGQLHGNLEILNAYRIRTKRCTASVPAVGSRGPSLTDALNINTMYRLPVLLPPRFPTPHSPPPYRHSPPIFPVRCSKIGLTGPSG